LSALDERRAEFAEELRRASSLRSDALVRAFGRVPREEFLGPGPWRILVPPRLERYELTASDDPAELCRDVLVAIDPSRHLNNGLPSALGRWFDALELRPGDHVLHLGCGVGYYTAILAETVGPEGQVFGIEADPTLAARAAANLRPWPNAQCAAGLGEQLARESFDAIFVNAGATHARASWLDALRPGGTLLLPLTVDAQPDIGLGFVFGFRREASRWPVSLAGPVGVFHCVGARDPSSERSLRDAFSSTGMADVRSLRRDLHEREADCWLHTPGFCLTRRTFH
jgi:protein-L-isoaspartate(D-aspartate) O-methyltransferase